jgi:Carboxymuconolactone decarboxylase family
VGTSGTLPTGPQPGDRQRTDRHEPSRPAPLSPRQSRDNGVTQDELIEAITHLAFYAGWPNALTAISVAKEVFQKN